MPAETPAPPREGRIVQLIIFQLARQEFAIPIGEVREIIRGGPITEVPGAPYFIRGMINVRGEIAVILDLKKRFGLPESETGGPNHVVITAQGKNLFAFIVDEVTEILRLSETEIKPTPELATKIDENYVSGFVMRAGRLIVLLDLVKVLSEQALTALAQARRRSPAGGDAPV